jgi:DNA (cytosine-5)-methyltransferase 1
LLPSIDDHSLTIPEIDRVPHLADQQGVDGVILKPFRYGSVCSGIEAATVAWHPLGWQPAFFSEIEKFPRAVLSHRWPDVPLAGDFTSIRGDEYGPIDLLVGGTPCQSFSTAGLRKGLADERGNLALEYLRLAARTRPRWIVWENVPGVLSSGKGRDFGSFLGALAELGYGFAYRVLDAQYFGVAQRRRRVFVVGYLGDWRSAAAVLFERESLCGYPPPSRKNGPPIAALTESGVGTCHVGQRGGDKTHVVTCIGTDCYNGQLTGDIAATLGTRGSSINSTGPTVLTTAVRRLTPKECERLQGFLDDYTLIPWQGKSALGCPDGPRYKALGNSMAVPVMGWIGRRITEVEALDLGPDGASRTVRYYFSTATTLSGR